MYSFQHSDSKRVSIEVLFQDSSSFVHSKSVCPSPVAFCEQTERAALKRWDPWKKEKSGISFDDSILDIQSDQNLK